MRQQCAKRAALTSTRVRLPRNPLEGRLRWHGRRGRTEWAGQAVASSPRSPLCKGVPMRRWLQYGGFAAGIVLIAFGAVAIAMGASGRSTVSDSLRLEKIVGSPDMTPAAIKAEAKAAGLTNVSLPTCSVAGKTVDSGSTARCF